MSCFGLPEWTHVWLLLPISEESLVIVGFLENDMAWRRFRVPFLGEL